jgi:hypothetical protein
VVAIRRDLVASRRLEHCTNDFLNGRGGEVACRIHKSERLSAQLSRQLSLDPPILGSDGTGRRGHRRLACADDRIGS